jgi:hypothetical protein
VARVLRCVTDAIRLLKPNAVDDAPEQHQQDQLATRRTGVSLQVSDVLFDFFVVIIREHPADRLTRGGL